MKCAERHARSEESPRPEGRVVSRLASDLTLEGHNATAAFSNCVQDAMTAPAVTVRGLRKRFGKVVALDGIDFEIPPGTVTGLLGPNGSGKTTTINILSTATRADGGSATVAGFDVRTQPAA